MSEDNKNEKQVKNTDNTNKILVCKQCGFEATTKDDMKLHKINAHNWCSNCFLTFKTEEELTKHISKMHMDKY